MRRNAWINLGFLLANLGLCVLLLWPSYMQAMEETIGVQEYLLPSPEYEEPVGAGEPESETEQPAEVVRGRVFRSLPTEDKVVALTFDDGPKSTLTKILAILKEKEVPATFFMLGSRVMKKPDLARKIAEAGCEAANHTWGHENLKKLSEGNVYWQIEACTVAFEARKVEFRPYVRPPYGNWDEEVQAVCARLNYDIVLWNSDSRDWEYSSPKTVLDRALKGVGPGSIVLFHDGPAVTLKVLPKFIDEVRARGYRFVLLSEYLDVP